ncbi:MAG: hypothetical protein JWN41_266, partial [Thermoleophilia bacterium]|nr:hypothetical protein [Thermoleophilia bacterium]
NPVAGVQAAKSGSVAIDAAAKARGAALTSTNADRDAKSKPGERDADAKSVASRVAGSTTTSSRDAKTDGAANPVAKTGDTANRDAKTGGTANRDTKADKADTAAAPVADTDAPKQTKRQDTAPLAVIPTAGATGTTSASLNYLQSASPAVYASLMALQANGTLDAAVAAEVIAGNTATLDPALVQSLMAALSAAGVPIGQSASQAHTQGVAATVAPAPAAATLTAVEVAPAFLTTGGI